MAAVPISLSESADLCLLVEDPIIEWYRAMVECGQIHPDEKQKRMVSLIQDFSKRVSTRLSASEAMDAKPPWLKLLLGSPGAREQTGHPLGMYIHGGVGTGKSMIMDAFFLQTPVDRKIRVHFHSFMQRLHREIQEHRSSADPLKTVSERISDRYGLICFDEFHVSDIADAMMLYRLLELLTGGGVHFVMTSNYAPSELYSNGLARDRFLPAIELLNSKFEVHRLDVSQDYRLRQLSKGKAYYFPLNEESEAELKRTFDRLANGIVVRPHIKVNGRVLNSVARTTGAIWFDFKELCATGRSQSDYLDLAERFSTLILSDIPRMESEDIKDVSRRFTLLVDVLYDMRVKLVCSAQVPLDQLYGTSEGGESGRTVSRLQEMQSLEYWKMPLVRHGDNLLR